MSIVARGLDHEGDVRARCEGSLPLSARLEPWQIDLCARPDELVALLELYGSPVNVLDPSPMSRNAAELMSAARQFDVHLELYFARKANKALAFVDEATHLGTGVDVASERELTQVLSRGVVARNIVMTAAVKPRPLLELCAGTGVTVVVDNADELALLDSISRAAAQPVKVALRLAPVVTDEHLSTRFGFGLDQSLDAVRRHWPAGPRPEMELVGVHFHVDGYEVGDRVEACGEAFRFIDSARDSGHRPSFVDIGGGIPMSYLRSGDQWNRFWAEHRRALVGERPALTFDGHGLGLVCHRGEIIGRANVYPYHQRPTRGEWLEQVLAGTPGETGNTVAEALRLRELTLRAEPGRALLDGCGLTAARVEFRKQRRDGTWLIGLSMNRTQCRSTSDDFMLDPLLVRPSAPCAGPRAPDTGPIEGYLVGAYCIERELLTWRGLRFGHGVEVGDVVVFPNTAGYQMHILESSSHQIPLARNVILVPGGGPSLDPIDSASGLR